jgi:putative lipoic acid-binding regulatory protein
VTITITATSREQLDAIYADLQDEPSVMAVL